MRAGLSTGQRPQRPPLSRAELGPNEILPNSLARQRSGVRMPSAPLRALPGPSPRGAREARLTVPRGSALHRGGHAGPGSQRQRVQRDDLRGDQTRRGKWKLCDESRGLPFTRALDHQDNLLRGSYTNHMLRRGTAGASSVSSSTSAGRKATPTPSPRPLNVCWRPRHGRPTRPAGRRPSTSRPAPSDRASRSGHHRQHPVAESLKPAGLLLDPGPSWSVGGVADVGIHARNHDHLRWSRAPGPRRLSRPTRGRRRCPPGGTGRRCGSAGCRRPAPRSGRGRRRPSRPG